MTNTNAPTSAQSLETAFDHLTDAFDHILDACNLTRDGKHRKALKRITAAAKLLTTVDDDLDAGTFTGDHRTIVTAELELSRAAVLRQLASL